MMGNLISKVYSLRGNVYSWLYSNIYVCKYVMKMISSSKKIDIYVSCDHDKIDNDWGQFLCTTCNMNTNSCMCNDIIYKKNDFNIIININ